jgi:hypothetical protein
MSYYGTVHLLNLTNVNSLIILSTLDKNYINMLHGSQTCDFEIARRAKLN